MFQTIMKLYDTQATATTVPVKGKYIYFGASIIYCDEKNSCMVYYPTDNNVLPDTSQANTTMITSVSS
jgi:hypothetical protein